MQKEAILVVFHLIFIFECEANVYYSAFFSDAGVVGTFDFRRSVTLSIMVFIPGTSLIKAAPFPSAAFQKLDGELSSAGVDSGAVSFGLSSSALTDVPNTFRN